MHETAPVAGEPRVDRRGDVRNELSSIRSGVRLRTRCRARVQQALRRDGGFTLLELLVVMVIIGLLAGLVAPRYFEQVGKSNTKIARAQVDSLSKALDQYRLDMGAYPTTEEGLQALQTKPQDASHWSGPYLQKAVPPDPLDRADQYRSPREHI